MPWKECKPMGRTSYIHRPTARRRENGLRLLVLSLLARVALGRRMLGFSDTGFGYSARIFVLLTVMNEVLADTTGNAVKTRESVWPSGAIYHNCSDGIAMRRRHHLQLKKTLAPYRPIIPVLSVDVFRNQHG